MIAQHMLMLFTAVYNGTVVTDFSCFKDWILSSSLFSMEYELSN